VTYPLTYITVSIWTAHATAYRFDLGVSSNLGAYQTSLYVINVGRYQITVDDNLGSSQTVAVGESKLVVLNSTGDGTTHLKISIKDASGHPMAFYASKASILLNGTEQIPSGDRDLTSSNWTADGSSSSTKTVTPWNLVPVPTSPPLRQIDFEINDSIGETMSPFTRQSQYQEWPGGDWWDWQLSLPPVKDSITAQNWESFFMELRGKMNIFQLGNPLRSAPRGSAAGLPAVTNSVSGTNLPLAKVLYTTGWTAGTSILLPGDYIQIGLRMHVVVGAPVDAYGGGGNAAIPIWPCLREQPTDKIAVVTSGPRGIWRLDNNKRAYSLDKSKMYAFGFKVTEAR
jgi:hypothetical protein